MKKIERIVKKLDSNLDFLEKEIEGVLEKSEEGIKVTQRALEQIRELLLKRKSASTSDEIYFFKNIKPQVFSKLIYYVKLFSIESKRPRSSNKSQVKYFNKHIDRLQNYFNDNLEFYHYYRRGATFLDNEYFIRGKANIRLFPDSLSFFADDKFSTSHDSTVATILAYDMLIIYLKTEIDKLENNNGMEANYNAFQKQSKLFWTGNKTDLIELIYALHSSGVINSGTADIKEVALICEQMFNVSLGDYYRTFLEIRSRKINQTKFIDKLKESLVDKMLESDE
ncbi:RteC domain-containing protein [Tenacibaculum sp. HL-MS23]|uniref:RteC domain-containing protein n=1 Tax=Polaribacter marinus TaxID=2916838 RepID=A0A9X2AHG3_9FLAO|nr:MULTISPECIES: RteC domain-containing protein [Flavobacteriaceae]MBU2940753.1 RteC domain-containing protein [Lacinutrix sp. C3R15]MCH3882388.1 RteC domain-containing protein [Tenacibaculum aquimarinum]MCI2227591.1 RteC domain-containing protein [Polaribacter marinus]MCT4699722.1 RteC domain-containing protein [Tenacibaculum haliotis]MDO6624071.1 RteC domain-containing protein [Oceanihabitans sp. 1_MG-2023]